MLKRWVSENTELELAESEMKDYFFLSSDPEESDNKTKQL